MSSVANFYQLSEHFLDVSEYQDSADYEVDLFRHDTPEYKAADWKIDGKSPIGN